MLKLLIFMYKYILNSIMFMNKIQKDYAWETIVNRITIQYSQAETISLFHK